VRRARSAALATAGLALALAGCGGSGGGGRPALVVSAATSLKQAFTSYGGGFAPAHVRLSFGGSDELAAQIRAGAAPDVFASANTKLPQALFAAGKVDRPVVFAGNRLVIAVPANSTKVRSLSDLARPGVQLAIGSPTVPIGAYTRKVLTRLPPARARAVLANVKSEEPDVGGIVGKVAEGAADAGFTYVTDVRAAGGRLRAVPIPAGLEPQVAYGVAVVRGTHHPEQARAFVRGLLSGAGRQALLRAGFQPPPRGAR
jgi:molybdate transport system substrate-binding protein